MTARGPSVARSAVAGLACRPGCTSLRSAPPPPRGTDDFPGPCNRPGRPFGRRGGAGRENTQAKAAGEAPKVKGDVNAQFTRELGHLQV